MIQVTITLHSYAAAAALFDKLNTEDDVVYSLAPATDTEDKSATDTEAKPRRTRRTKAEMAAAALATAALDSPTAQVVTPPAPPAAAPAPVAPPAPAPAPAPAPVAPPDNAGAALDYERDVRPLGLKFSAALGTPAFVALLGEFGVSNAKQLAPEQYAPFVARLNAALAQPQTADIL